MIPSPIQQTNFKFLATWLQQQSPLQTEVYANGGGNPARILEHIPINAQTTVDIETFLVEHERLATRHYFLQRNRLPQDKKKRECIILQILRLSNENSFLIFGVDEEEELYAFHQIKCDQATEGLLDDYYRFRQAVFHLIENLPKIINDAIETCES